MATKQRTISLCRQLHCKRTLREGGRTCFTLLDLLIVVAVIAILASLLLPALNKAMERVRMTSCVSNLRQIGVIWQVYQTESQGYFPPDGASSPYMSWEEYFYAYNTHCSLIQGNYFKNNLRFTLYRCPSSVKGLGSKGYHYASNRFLAKARNEKNVRYPSKRMMIGEAATETTGLLSPEKVGYRHMFSGNFLFMDGHVLSLHTYDYTNGDSVGSLSYWTRNYFWGAYTNTTLPY